MYWYTVTSIHLYNVHDCRRVTTADLSTIVATHIMLPEKPKKCLLYSLLLKKSLAVSVSSYSTDTCFMNKRVYYLCIQHLYNTHYCLTLFQGLYKY
jgi:hypothetical protein